MAEIRQRITTILMRYGKKPMTIKDLYKRAGIKKSESDEFNRILERMIKEGVIARNKSRLVLSKNLGLVPGKITKVKSTFGFAKLENNDREVFIPGRDLLGSMPGDRVLLKLSRTERELDEGQVYSILERSEYLFSGEIVGKDKELFIMPDNGVRVPLKVDQTNAPDLSVGDKVVARLTFRGESHFDHRAGIVEDFGPAQLAKNCCEAILSAAGIRREFPQAVEEGAKAASEAPMREEEIKGRLDLREELIFTIDSADSKDMDDAVSLKKLEDGWELGVHIADVSYYVRPGSELDREAMERGTSIYFADSVIPMLPVELSNGICSLNPGADRLAFSAIMTLEKSGAIRGFNFKKTVIRSRVKGVYREVNQILAKTAGEEILKKYDGLIDMIQEMAKLADTLSKRRFARGALDLDSTEAKITVDENGRAADVALRERGESERIIEEFMLVANESAAVFAKIRLLPFVYRIHEKPSPERIDSLKKLLDAIGIPNAEIFPDCPPERISVILKKAQATQYGALVNNTIVRSMAKARYSVQDLGHYGLALADYCHFTSPIRRYPDLSIHRVMSFAQSGMQDEALHRQFEPFCKESADHSSMAEVRAMGLERDCESCYEAEYMTRFLGHQFDGIVTSATSQGLYVSLPNTIEGFVKLERLPNGCFLFDGMMKYSNADGSKSIQVGDPVRIQVDAANVSSGEIDFSIVGK